MLWGTAGHVDHGKTTLVRALTGVDCDRLEEEKRRGITIALGFARWVLPDGRAISVVDVPGHERLVRTMLVGAAGLDAVLLVVSAEAGVMPQTREHLAACRVLGVERGVVALTFADRVADVEAARAAVRAELADTAFADADIVPVVAPTGAGLDALAAAVARVADALPPRDLEAPALLPIDRVFSVEGFGTVVTGSLVRGRLAVGDRVDLVPRPAELRARDALRIKGLQSHGRAVEQADAGQRVAVNLACDRRLVERGAALCAPGSVHVGRVFDAEVRWLPHAGPPPRRARGLALHVGADRALADVRLDAAFEPGGLGTARVRLDRPVALPAGARFVLRGEPDARHGAVVGGGRVLDTAPPRKRKAAGRALLAHGDAAARLAQAVAEAGPRGATPEALHRRLGVPLPDGPRRFAPDALAAAEDALVAAVRAWHAARPHDPGLPLDNVGHAEVERRARARAVEAGRLVREGAFLRLPDHRAGLAEVDQRLARKVLRAIGQGGLAGPTKGEIFARFPADDARIQAVLEDLERRGRVVRAGDFLLPGREARALRTRVARAALAGPLSVGWLKSEAGLTRRHAIPVYTWLDACGATHRDGDVRVAGSRAAQYAEESDD